MACPCTNVVITFGSEKLEWWVYQMVKSLKICLLVLIERDRQTLHHIIGHAMDSVVQQKL